jgi:seryl-tRNA synthetase
MKRTVLASALSFAVAFGATLPAYAQDVVINADGSVTVPEALRPYMGGLEVISAE